LKFSTTLLLPGGPIAAARRGRQRALGFSRRYAIVDHQFLGGPGHGRAIREARPILFGYDIETVLPSKLPST